LQANALGTAILSKQLAVIGHYHYLKSIHQTFKEQKISLQVTRILAAKKFKSAVDENIIKI
jgi:hypothetical protein